MKAELLQLFTPKAKHQIQDFKDLGIDMDSDEHLFWCYNENFKPEYQVPSLVPGFLAKERLADGYYRLEYYGPNSSSKSKRRAQKNREAAERGRAAVAKAMKEAKKPKAPLESIEKDDKITVKEKPKAKAKAKSVVIE